MKFQKRYLNALINHQRLDLWDDNVPHCFYDKLNMDILQVCYALMISKEPITEQTVKTVISQGKYSETYRQKLFGRLKEVTSLEVLVSSNLRKVLREEYIDWESERMGRYMTNPENTPEMREEYIKKVYQRVSANERQESKKLSDLMRDRRDGYDTEESAGFFEKSIQLDAPHWRALLGQRLYPQPYLFIARPGGMKTSFLIDLQHELVTSGKMGVHFTWEDSLEMYELKYTAIALDVSKEDLGLRKVPKQKIDDCLAKLRSDVIVEGGSASGEEMKMFLQRKIDKYDIRWFSIDFLSMVRIKRGQNEMEALRELVHCIRDVCSHNLIPCIALSQVPMDRNRNADILESSDVYGSSVIENVFRNVSTINMTRDDQGSWERQSPKRLWHDSKKTMGLFRDYEVTSNMESGKIYAVSERRMK